MFCTVTYVGPETPSRKKDSSNYREVYLKEDCGKIHKEFIWVNQPHWDKVFKCGEGTRVFVMFRKHGHVDSRDPVKIV